MPQNYLKIEQTAGAAGTGVVAKVPLEMLQDLRTNAPIPVTISGTSQRVFTVAASKTNPVRFLYGTDFYDLKSSTSYTWTAGTNNILATDGSASTVDGGAVTVGVWYMYLGMDSSGVLSLRPSTAAPAYVEGPFQTGYLGHPGTARAQAWQYVGVHVATANTPVFLAADKVGKHYNFAAQSVNATSDHAALDFSAVVPAHGVKVSGYVTHATAAGNSVSLTGSSTSGRGVQTMVAETSRAPVKNFSSVPATSSGTIYGVATAGTTPAVSITAFEDVV